MDTFDYILILTWFWLIMLGIKVLELNKANKELAKRVGFLEEELELDTDDEEK